MQKLLLKTLFQGLTIENVIMNTVQCISSKDAKV